MIQKLLALLFSLLLALSGSVPTDILPSDREGASGEGDVGVLTRPGPDGDARPLNVAWTKVDGETVEEARWGVGEVDRLAFQVGVHASPPATLGIAGDEVAVGPTDVIVLENFDGRFKFQRVGTADETLLLDGAVKRTSVAANEGSRVTTESANEAGGASSSTAPPEAGNASKVEHVVIENEPVDGVSIARGDAERVTTQGPRAPQPVNVLASWVTVEGERLDDYVSGEGLLGSVTFQVGAYPDGQHPQLNVSGDLRDLSPGTKVRVEGFQGSYLIYQVDDGGNRVQLNGVADDITIPSSKAQVLAGEEPVPRFSFVPSSPATNDTINFQDRSYDPDGGRKLLYEWHFGDGTTSIEQNPRHSYDRPGQYRVSLEVTDDELTSNVTTVVIDVDNTPPQADFEWHPEDPTDTETVHFTSNARDSDGDVVEHRWDFDDGTTATGPQPEHTFPDDGAYEVTHTAVDDAGGTTDVTRVVPVDNVAPEVDFTWNPSQPKALDPVEFTSQTRDPDGSIEDLTWRFGDGTSASGSNPVHHYDDDGTYEVTLEARDDDGDVSEKTKEIQVRNRPPEVDFTIETSDPVTGQEVSFSEEATDRDGSVRGYQWDFGDGDSSSAANPTHAYDAANTYRVTLTVTDDEGAKNSTSKVLTVSNAPPEVDFLWNPEEPLDQNEVTFSDLTVDPDGSGDLESWYWTFDDGNDSHARNPTHVFPDDGLYNVTLAVEDSVGHNVSRTHDVLVRNQPPTIDSINFDPARPDTRDNITMTMTAHDPDGKIVDHEWVLPNGTVLEGRVVNTTLPEGDHDITARAIDDDGAPGQDTRQLIVFPGPPIANFTWQPQPAVSGQPVDFIDTTDPGDAPLDRWEWTFDDGNKASGPDPNHTYANPGTYSVELWVEDKDGRRDTVTKDVFVTAPPDVDFTYHPEEPSAGENVTFNGTGHDPDGQIVNWTWTFGDGTQAYGQNVTHSFPVTGDYTVQLAATDDDGATATAADTVTVVNNAPEVDFTYSPLRPMAGTTVNFTDESTDPDGTIEQRIWSFGDGDQATGEEVSHAYDSSDVYTVTLEAVDDLGKVGVGTRDVAVTSPHEITLQVRVVYPTGEPIDFDNVPLETSFTVEATGLTAGPGANKTVEETSDGISRATFDAGEWVAGEPITWKVTGPRTPTRTVTFTPPADAFFREKGPVAIVVPVDAAIEVDPGDRAVLGSSPPENSQRYADPTEPVTGNVTLTWVTGTPVRNSSIGLEVKYDGPLRNPPVGGALNQYAEVPLDTGSDGRAAFTVPPTFSGDLAAYLPGYYELTVRRTYDAGLNSVFVFADTHFYEDPAGLTGLLLGTSGPQPATPDPGDAVTRVAEAVG